MIIKIERRVPFEDTIEIEVIKDDYILYYGPLLNPTQIKTFKENNTLVISQQLLYKYDRDIIRKEIERIMGFRVRFIIFKHVNDNPTIMCYNYDRYLKDEGFNAFIKLKKKMATKPS